MYHGGAPIPFIWVNYYISLTQILRPFLRGYFTLQSPSSMGFGRSRWGRYHHFPPEKFPLVGGIPTPLKNMFINWDDDIPNIWKNKSHIPVTTNQQVIGGSRHVRKSSLPAPSPQSWHKHVASSWSSRGWAQDPPKASAATPRTTSVQHSLLQSHENRWYVHAYSNYF